MKRVLVTGFEPFAGQVRNPSAEIALALDGRMIAAAQITGTVLPCVFGTSIVALQRAMRRVDPDYVICLGQAGGRAEITPERVALNLNDAPVADNAGAQPIDEFIVARGPAAYWSTLPVKAIVAALRERGFPASVSQTAGTFVCNHVFYGLMHALQRAALRNGRRRRPVRGGFIHVPFLPEQATDGRPSLPLATMIEAIACAVDTVLRAQKPARHAWGATH